MTLTQTVSHRPWSQLFTAPASEFPLTPLPILSGQLPPGLQGSLYRNGPGRLERGGMRVGHWFDGDGAILAVHFTPEGATGVYRYVKTPEFQQEERENRLIYAGYGMNPPGNLWERFTKPLKNAANTSVLALPDQLLALWEGGHPYSLDLHTLETRGTTDLNGLVANTPFSAHPKVDPDTGDIFNFGQSLGSNVTLNLYRSDRTGKIQQKNQLPLDEMGMIHDFVLAGNYLVFVIPPIQLEFLPVLTRLQPFSEALVWKPEEATQILIFDRQTLQLVYRLEAVPWFQWHFSNGYVTEDGTIMIDLARYNDFQTNQYLKEVATGKTQTLAKSTLWRLEINSKSGKLLSQEELLDRHCEFPTVTPPEVGKKANYTYLSVYPTDVNPVNEILGTIARFDHNNQTLTEANIGKNCYAVEPIYATDQNNPQQGWVLTVVYDGNQNSSQVWVFDADHLDEEPVCKLTLPSVVPNGFHGTWKATI